MSRTRRLLGGMVMTYGYQALLVVVGIWLTPFYLRHIGQHDYGLWLVGTQLLTYLMLTDFGVVALLPLETAYATGRAGSAEKAADLPQLVGQTARIVMLQLPIVAVLAFAMWWTIPAEWHDLRGPLAVILLAFVLGFPLRILPALLQGLQDLTFANALQIFTWLVTTASTVFMVLRGWNLYALAMGWLIGQFVFAPVCVYRLITRFPGVLPRKLPPMVWSAVKSQLGKGFWVSVSQVAQVLIGSTDLLIIGRMFGPAAVVPYSCTGKLATVLGNQANILLHTATPALCELKAGEARQRVFQAMVGLTQGLLTFSGLVFCVVMVVNHWFVDWWVTGSQYGGIALTAMFLATSVVRHLSITAGYGVFCFGYQRRICLTNLAEAVVATIACLILTLLFGLSGAAAGPIAGAVLVGLPWNLSVLARDMGVTVPHLLLTMLKGWLWRFAILGGSCLWLGLHWSPKSLPEAAIASALIALVYCLVMLSNVLHSQLGIYLQSIVASLRGRVPLKMRVSS